MQLSQITETLAGRYDPSWAESWDAVGLVCGDPEAEVTKILFAVDPVAEVIEEALDLGAELIVTHHPLLLRPVSSVAATTPKGRAIHRLIRAGCALYTAHTNADVADPGVSDALARAVGLTGELRPLAPSEGDPRRGLGRIGALAEPMTLRDFAARAERGLPRTTWGIRTAGDPDRIIRDVAVCGGAGDSLIETARAAGADVYLTSDLRHHPASESLEKSPMALVDAAHWATEWPWLADAAALLDAHAKTVISTLVTDAWNVPRTNEGAL